MTDNAEPSANPRRIWPWLLLAAAVLAVVLAIVWIRVEVQRVRRFQRIGPATAPPTQATNAVLMESRDMVKYLVSLK
jgi:hypothetical protein